MTTIFVSTRCSYLYNLFKDIGISKLKGLHVTAQEFQGMFVSYKVCLIKELLTLSSISETQKEKLNKRLEELGEGDRLEIFPNETEEPVVSFS